MSNIKEKDKITTAIEKVFKESREPMETKEIFEKALQSHEDVTRSKVLYRLNDLRGQGEIVGKFVGSGKGVWIWWKKNAWEKQC